MKIEMSHYSIDISLIHNNDNTLKKDIHVLSQFQNKCK